MTCVCVEEEKSEEEGPILLGLGLLSLEVSQKNQPRQPEK